MDFAFALFYLSFLYITFIHDNLDLYICPSLIFVLKIGKRSFPARPLMVIVIQISLNYYLLVYLTSSPRVDEAESVGYDFLENP